MQTSENATIAHFFKNQIKCLDSTYKTSLGQRIIGKPYKWAIKYFPLTGPLIRLYNNFFCLLYAASKGILIILVKRIKISNTTQKSNKQKWCSLANQLQSRWYNTYANPHKIHRWKTGYEADMTSTSFTAIYTVYFVYVHLWPLGTYSKWL